MPQSRELEASLRQTIPASLRQTARCPHQCSSWSRLPSVDEPGRAGAGDAPRFDILSPASPDRRLPRISLCDHRRITILPVETNQSDLWGESEVPQVGRDGPQGRGKLTTIVTIAPACIGADPLARMHLQRRSACANHLPSLASCVATRADRVEPSFRWRECWVAGQSPLACGLPGGIDIKDDVTTPQTARRSRQGFPVSILAQSSAARKAREKLLHRDGPRQPESGLSWSDGEALCAQTAP